MGFHEEISEIVRMAPKKRQTMLFSATFSEQVRQQMIRKHPLRSPAYFWSWIVPRGDSLLCCADCEGCLLLLLLQLLRNRCGSLRR